jgi:hypothetical protein
MFDENLLKIWIEKTYNQTIDQKDKGWKVLKENDDECCLSFQPKHKHTTFKTRAQVVEEDKIDVVTLGWSIRAKFRSLRWCLHLLGF